MKPVTLVLTCIMIFTGAILIVLGCVFGYTSIAVYLGKSDKQMQLISNGIATLIFILTGYLLFYKGVKLIRKK